MGAAVGEPGGGESPMTAIRHACVTLTTGWFKLTAQRTEPSLTAGNLFVVFCFGKLCRIEAAENEEQEFCYIRNYEDSRLAGIPDHNRRLSLSLWYNNQFNAKED